MKKITLVALLFAVGISYGQTKTKENKSKKVVSTETTKEEKISIVEINPNSDGETVGNPYGNVPVFDEKEDDNTIYNSAGIEVQPEFPGGNDKLVLYISKSFQYSEEMEEAGLKGKLIATFVVERDGSITDIKIIHGLGYGTERAVVNVLKKMPRWNPAVKNGKKVRCSFIIPFTIDATKQ